MARYDGIFVGGPKNGKRFVSEHSIIEFPEMPKPLHYGPATTPVDQTIVLKVHRYIWADEQKHWVYVE